MNIKKKIKQEVEKACFDIMQDLSWRGVRYASNGNFEAHDYMLEAYNAVRGYVTPNAEPYECNCKERYASKSG